MRSPYALQHVPKPQTMVVDNELVGDGPFFLPNICVCCGKPTAADTQRLNSHLKKSSPWAVVAFLFGGLLAWMIAHYVTRKTTTVHYSICDECMLKQRQKRLTMAGGLIWCGLVMLSGAFVGELFIIGLISTSVFLAGMSIWRRFPIFIRKHKDGMFYLSGVNHNILNHIDQPKMFPLPAPHQLPQHYPRPTMAPPVAYDGTDGNI